MKESLSRIWQVTASECCGSARSRRVLVVMLLYVVAAVACMAVVTNMLGKIEAELVKLMQLPASDHTGLVSAALWKSQHFRWIVENFVRDRLVFQDIVGRHPVELIYAWFAIMFSPMLAVLAASNRVSDDLRSGSARYVIVRVARIEWTLGKYFGQAAIIAVALAASAFGAWATAACMLSGVGAWDLLPAMFEWSARAGVCSLAWLGLVLGVSHVFRSASVATTMCMVAIVLCSAWGPLLHFGAYKTGAFWLLNLDALVPGGPAAAMWRRGLAPLVSGSIHLMVLGFFYLMIGHAIFRRRDA